MLGVNSESNWASLYVFWCSIIALDKTSDAEDIFGTFKFIKSQDRSLLSMAQFNKTNCSGLFSISTRILIRQISPSLNTFSDQHVYLYSKLS